MDHKADWRRNVGTRFRQLADAFEDDQKNPRIASVSLHESGGQSLGNRVFWYSRKQIDRIASDCGRLDELSEDEAGRRMAGAFLADILANVVGETKAFDEEVGPKSWPFEMLDRARVLVVEPTTWGGSCVDRSAYVLDDATKADVRAGLLEYLEDESTIDDDPTDKSPDVEHGDNGSATAETETAAIDKPGKIQEVVAMIYDDPKPRPGQEGTFPDPDRESAKDARIREDRDFEAFMKAPKPAAAEYGPADILHLIRVADFQLRGALAAYKAIGLHVGVVTAAGAIVSFKDRPILIPASIPDAPSLWEDRIRKLHASAEGDGAHFAAWLEFDAPGKPLVVKAFSLNRFPLDVGFTTLEEAERGYLGAMRRLLDAAVLPAIDDDVTEEEENETGRFVVYQAGIPNGDLCRRHTLERAERARDEAAPNHTAGLSIRDSLHF